jgi:molybdate transport system regulatory protein
LKPHPQTAHLQIAGANPRPNLAKELFLIHSPSNYKNVVSLYFIYKIVNNGFSIQHIIKPLTIWHDFNNTKSMENPFYIESEFEIKKHGQTFLNDRRIKLLKAIKKNGSIRSASSDIKMSYQQAWHFIKEMNELSPLPLVVYKRGGSNGGGTELTRHGELAIVEFKKLIQKTNSVNKKFSDTLWICDFFR